MQQYSIAHHSKKHHQIAPKSTQIIRKRALGRSLDHFGTKVAPKTEKGLEKACRGRIFGGPFSIKINKKMARFRTCFYVVVPRVFFAEVDPKTEQTIVENGFVLSTRLDLIFHL